MAWHVPRWSGLVGQGSNAKAGSIASSWVPFRRVAAVLAALVQFRRLRRVRHGLGSKGVVGCGMPRWRKSRQGSSSSGVHEPSSASQAKVSIFGLACQKGDQMIDEQQKDRLVLLPPPRGTVVIDIGGGMTFIAAPVEKPEPKCDPPKQSKKGGLLTHGFPARILQRMLSKYMEAKRDRTEVLRMSAANGAEQLRGCLGLRQYPLPRSQANRSCGRTRRSGFHRRNTASS